MGMELRKASSAFWGFGFNNIIILGGIIVYFRDGKYFIYDSTLFSKLRADKLTQETLENLGGTSVVRLSVYKGSEMLIPTLESYPENTIEIPGFYKMFEKTSNFDLMLKKRFPNILDSVIARLMEVANNLKNMSTYPEHFKAYMVGDTEAVNLFNRKASVGQLTLNVPNETIFQTTADDDIFIKLPSDVKMKSLTESTVDELSIPSLSHVFVPYPSILYNTYGVKQVLEASPVNKLSEIQVVVDRLKEAKFSNIPTEKEFLKAIDTPLPLRYILGSDDNDLLPIRKSEQGYYDALNTFIKHHTEVFLRETLRGKSDEEIKTCVERDLKIGRLPGNIQVYLKELVTNILTYHWSHTGAFMIDLNFFDEDPGNTKVGQEALQYLCMNPDFKMEEGGSGDLIVMSYIHRCARDYGYTVWSEAVIKLLRWGEYKPKSLILGDETNTNMLNLEKFKITTLTAPFANMEKVKDSKGRTYFANALIVGTATKDGIGMDYPAALLVEHQYISNPVTNEFITLQSLVALTDLIDDYVRGNSFVSGIDFIDGKFVVDPDVDDKIVEMALRNQTDTEGYISKYLYDLRDVHKLPKSSKTYITAQIEEMILTEYLPEGGDYIQHLANYNDTEIPSALGGIFLKIYRDTLELQDEEILGASFEEVINDCFTHVYPKFRKAIYSMLSGETESEEIRQNTVDELKKVKVFSGMTSGADEGVESIGDDCEENRFSVPGNILEKMVYNGNLREQDFKSLISVRNIGGEKKKTHVGWVRYDPKDPVVIFASLNDGVQVNPLSKISEIQYDAAVSTLLLTTVLNHLGENIPVTKSCQVASLNTIKEILAKR